MSNQTQPVTKMQMFAIHEIEQLIEDRAEVEVYMNSKNPIGIRGTIIAVGVEGPLRGIIMASSKRGTNMKNILPFDAICSINFIDGN
jgi:hypothetical protein